MNQKVEDYRCLHTQKMKKWNHYGSTGSILSWQCCWVNEQKQKQIYFWWRYISIFFKYVTKARKTKTFEQLKP